MPRLLVVVLLQACRLAAPVSQVGPSCVSEDSTASVAVSVVDATGRPVQDTEVSADWMQLSHSDSSGSACVLALEGDTTVLRVRRLGFLPESATVRLRAGDVVGHAFTLLRVDRPCCRLEGAWQVQLRIERLNLQQPEPTSRSISGLVVFSDRLPNWTRWSGDVDSIVRYESGYSAIDLEPFFGGPYATDVSTSVFGGGETLFREMTGIVPEADSVKMTLIPRMSHGGLSFRGRITGDTIRGRWVQNAYCCGADGEFVMHRVSSSATSDSIIADALRAHERGMRVSDSIQRERSAAAQVAAERRRVEGEEKIPPARISIEGNDGSSPGDHLLVGQRSRLATRIYRTAVGAAGARDIPGIVLDWSSTDLTVITVDSLGRVEARSPGHAYAVARMRATVPDARFADGVTDSMPFVVEDDAGGLGRRRFAEVSAAAVGGPTCVVTSDAGVDCLHKVPGDAREVDDVPVLASVDSLGNRSVSAVATGAAFACALLDDTQAWCWGENAEGELADGDTASRLQPRPVLGGLRFRRIAAARTHVCAITVEDALYCWGMMLNGGLGPHAVDDCSVSIQRLAAHGPPGTKPTLCARRPVPLLEGHRVRDVAVGDDHTCAIGVPLGRGSGAPELYCWGGIYNIELQSTTPVRMEMPGEPLVSLTSGSEHMCGLTAAGEAWCLGRNWYGQGGARTEPRSGSRRPMRVATDVRFQMLSAGGEHTCGIALDGRAWCWGYNRRGQLGRGTIDEGGTTPTLVAGGLQFRSIAAGSSHTCATSTAGALWCWGNGLAFRTQPGSFHEQPEPYPVAGWQVQP